MESDHERPSGSVKRISANQFHIDTHIDIDAPASDVWATLTDWENLASWSSSFISLVGEFEEGGHVEVAFRVMGTTQKYEHDLIEFVDGSQFAWSDPFLLGMVDHHVFRVEAISDDSARFHHSDQVKDGAARFIGALMARTMKRMYVGFNQELATEVARRRSETG